jgi:predicted  nucleic acid-binding Zn-ribbon protein
MMGDQMQEVIDHASLRVAKAEAGLDAANTKLAAARTAADEINSRVAALETERAGIVAAARTGDADPAAGLRLAVLDADLADLRKIAADGKAGLANAQAEVQRASQAVAAAEQALALAKDEEMERQLVAHVDQLAQLLGTAVAELRTIWRRKRARPTWSPTTELLRELQSLRFVADGRQSDGITGRRSAA